MTFHLTFYLGPDARAFVQYAEYRRMHTRAIVALYGIAKGAWMPRRMAA
jgi:hypothetical protein